MPYADLVHRALDFAAVKHREQVRKSPEAEIPYLAHCAGVALVLTRHGMDEEVVAAGVLHDVVEDCGVTGEELEREFGARVRHVVEHCSEQDKSLPWEARKAAYIARLRTADGDARAVSAADKLHNMRSLLKSARLGLNPFANMKRGRDVQLDRFRRFAEALGDGWSHPLVEEVQETLTALERETAPTESAPPPPSPGLPPLATVAPWDLVAEAYAAEVVPTFEHFAHEALLWAGVGSGHRVVDVAAGPGTLSFLAAERGAEVEALDFSPAMVDRLQARLAAGSHRSIHPQVGDGQALPFAEGSFDAGFSMFGLMFFPDRAQGLRELARVVKPGAPVVISSWESMAGIPFFATVFGAMAEAFPPPPGAPPPGPFALATPEACIAEFEAAGLSSIEVRRAHAPITSNSMDELWAGMQRTNAAVRLLAARVGAETFSAFAAGLRSRLIEQFGNGPQRVEMLALLTLGRRP